jgi:hypothetical protein
MTRLISDVTPLLDRRGPRAGFTVINAMGARVRWRLWTCPVTCARGAITST